MTDEELEDMIKSMPKFLLNEGGRLFRVKCVRCGIEGGCKKEIPDFTCGICSNSLDRIIVYNMTLRDIEDFFIHSYLKRSKQFNKEYLYYKDIMCGNFDVYSSEEEHKKDHEILKGILMDMVKRGIFEKNGNTYKLIS